MSCDYHVMCVLICNFSKELERLKPPDSRDVREIVEKEIERERMRLETTIVQYKERFNKSLLSSSL